MFPFRTAFALGGAVFEVARFAALLMLLAAGLAAAILRLAAMAATAVFALRATQPLGAAAAALDEVLSFITAAAFVYDVPIGATILGG